MSIYQFIKSKIVGAGTGSGDLAFKQQMNLTPASFYSPRYMVQKSFRSSAPAFVKMGQDIIPVSILGDSGLDLAGNIELGPLAKGRE